MPSPAPSPFRSIARRGALAALTVAALLGAAPGCQPIRAGLKSIGIIRAPQIELTEQMPQDFELVIKVVDQESPAADYTVWVRRSGKCEYKAEVRKPKRRASDGTFDIYENQVQEVWNLIRQASYADLDDRYPSSGEGPDKALGTQAYSVRVNDLYREVQAVCERVPELEAIRTKVLSFLPAKALADTGRGDPVAGKSKQIVGDILTKIFYPADDKRLEEVPADRRQPFASWQDAVNFEYRPIEGFKPWEQEP